MPGGLKTCTRHKDCHQWGECVIGQNGQPSTCKCRDWYVGDGFQHCGPPGSFLIFCSKKSILTNLDEEIYSLPSETNTQAQCGKYNCDINADCVTDAQGAVRNLKCYSCNY